MTARAIRVTDPGAFTTVQDRGRRGFAHLGVPRSGFLDAPAAELANRLVGNPEGAAVLETTLTGVSFVVECAAAVAVTGAWAEVRVEGRAVAWGEPVSVAAGAHVEVGPATRGLRSYVALAGGLEPEAALGSRSYDSLSGIGPAPLRAGDRLPLGGVDRPPRPVHTHRPEPGRPLVRVRPGPRDDWFEASWRERITASTYVVDARSNRIAVRLSGQRLTRAVPRELPSEGLVLGAVQVPADGHPLVFLNDHPTTGGYPVVGVVLEEDLAALAQLRPGDQIGFAVVD